MALVIAATSWPNTGMNPMAEQPKYYWTERATRAIADAGKSSTSAGSEQLLRSLIRVSGMAAEVLRRCGVDLAAMMAAIEQCINDPAASGLEPSEQPTIIEGIKRGARAEAQTLRHNFTGTEHLLLSILSGESSHAREILLKFKVDYALAHEKTLKVMYGE